MSFSQETRCCLLICLLHCMVLQTWQEYKSCRSGVIYTVTHWIQTDRKHSDVYLFEGRKVGIGFVCFWTVVLALVPPPSGIQRWLRPLTSPNGCLILVKATVGPLLPFLPMMPTSGRKGTLPQFYTEGCLQELGSATLNVNIYKNVCACRGSCVQCDSFFSFRLALI